MSTRDLQLDTLGVREQHSDSMDTEEDEVDDSPKRGSANTPNELETVTMERGSLGTEVEQLRNSLKEIQAKHQQELATVNEQLEKAVGEKENADSKYRDLLGRVSTIKSQLGERLRADAVGKIILTAFIDSILTHEVV
jgi:DNA repair exonuclease SbcCD ATPase subunit